MDVGWAVCFLFVLRQFHWLYLVRGWGPQVSNDHASLVSLSILGSTVPYAERDLLSERSRSLDSSK